MKARVVPEADLATLQEWIAQLTAERDALKAALFKSQMYNDLTRSHMDLVEAVTFYLGHISASEYNVEACPGRKKRENCRAYQRLQKALHPTSTEGEK